MHQLGSVVDSVEIDGTVVDFARKYFDFRPKNVYVEDALVFLDRVREEVASGRRRRYNHVIHDVFTGGTVPVALFSQKTFRCIREIMADDGVIAVNFVGVVPSNISESSKAFVKPGLAVRAVVTRMRAVFGHVRIFSDGIDEAESGYVHNIVLFACVDGSRVGFRQFTEMDVLDSSIREEALEQFAGSETEVMSLDGGTKEASNEVINAGQIVTAAHHWRLMRNVFSQSLWAAIAR
jgi:hypothetical protein